MVEERKKYWILTTEYFPIQKGGIGTYVYHTARMFSNNNYQVTIFLYDLSVSSDIITEENGIRLIRFSPDKTHSGGFLGFNARISYEYAAIVKRYIISEGVPEILEAQEYHGIAYYIQQFKKLGYKFFSDLNILITCHAPSFLCLEYNQVPVYQLPYYWIGQMEKACIKSADLLICPSKYFVQQAKSRMYWGDIMEKYVMNPIEVSDTNTFFDYENNYIVCFGKLSPLKGTFELLKYFKDLWDSGFHYSLHIIGGSNQFFHPERMAMIDLVTKKYGKYIKEGLLIIEGELSAEKAKEKLIKAHVVIVPSIFDNMPYTVLEAMSWGKIVLASCQGGQSEVIRDNENGFLFDHFTKEDFQNKLKYILEQEKDFLKEIGRNAINSIREKCSLETVFKCKIEVINCFFQNKNIKPEFPFVYECENRNGPKNIEVIKEKLSIVIPFYNMGKYIEECINSILNSDYPDKEIIIIDDGSTNKSDRSILASIQKQHNVDVYHKKNEGLSLTRNFGALKATGGYLAFLDADDTVEKAYYSKAIRVLSKYENIYFVGSWVKYFGNSTQCWPTFNPEPPYLLVQNMINSSALVYKKEAFLQYGLNKQELIYGLEDWDSVISMIENGCRGVVLPELLFNYRVRHNSMVRSFTRAKKLYLYNRIAQNHKSLFKKYGSDIAQLLNANSIISSLENPTMDSTFISRSGPVRKIFRSMIELTKRNKYASAVAYQIYKKIKK